MCLYINEYSDIEETSLDKNLELYKTSLFRIMCENWEFYIFHRSLPEYLCIKYDLQQAKKRS